jgi:hypothetical protein
LGAKSRLFAVIACSCVTANLADSGMAQVITQGYLLLLTHDRNCEFVCLA